jgi:hypothetical protein
MTSALKLFTNSDFNKLYVMQGISIAGRAFLKELFRAASVQQSFMGLIVIISCIA